VTTWRQVAILVCLSNCGFSGAESTDAGVSRIDSAVTRDAGTADAARPDAKPPFSIDMCPAGYEEPPLVSNGSKYRGGPLSSRFTWEQAESRCANDSAGLTHLFVADSDAELFGIALATQVKNGASNTWIGHFTISQGGGLVDVSVVGPGYVMPRPDAANTMPGANTAYYTDDNTRRGPRLGAVDRNTAYNYICECDGKAPTNLPP
jgi:hypothetical protein